MRIFITLGIFTIFALLSCGRKPIEIEIFSERNIKYESIAVDTVQVELENTTFTGFSGVNDGKLYFFDSYFCYLYLLDADGNILERALGQGRAGYEVPVRYPTGFCSAGAKSVVMDGTYHAFIYDSLKNFRILGFEAPGNLHSLAHAAGYTLLDEVVMRSHGDYFYYNIMGSLLDPITDRKYYRDAAIIMRVDEQSAVAQPIGSYSSIYTENPDRLRHLLKVYYDIDDRGMFHITYQADSLIYIGDNDAVFTAAYGFQGKDMNLKYENPSPTEENFGKAFLTDNEHKGYYYWIENVEGTPFTFRSYQKGSHSEFDGLQVYEDKILVADVEVPKNFSVAGYIEPYFVTNILCDEETDDLKFYRFKLD